LTNKTANFLLSIGLIFFITSCGNEINVSQPQGSSIKPESKNELVARGWIADKSIEATQEYVTQHMADDGILMGDRFVGFGFEFDSSNHDQKEMIVSYVNPKAPAAKVLLVGDVFVSVAGVPATKENRTKLKFRGKPGESIKAKIKREGKVLDIEVARAVINSQYDKAKVLADIAKSNVKDWGNAKNKISEVFVKDNVVLVISVLNDIEPETNIPYESNIGTRFEFNALGKVSRISKLSEDRFVLEQQGYSITR